MTERGRKAQDKNPKWKSIFGPRIDAKDTNLIPVSEKQQRCELCSHHGWCQRGKTAANQLTLH